MLLPNYREGAIDIIQLKNIYPGIGQRGHISYGGNQRWLESPVLQRCGCGVVAALDLVRYLHLYHPGCAASFFTGVENTPSLPRQVYDLCAVRMHKGYVPVLWPLGTNGLSLAAGMNRYFRRYNLPLRARWGLTHQQIWPHIEEMLRQDIPVILSIGNNFPRMWRREKAVLYQKTADESLRESCRVRAHFVTVTGIDAKWMQISSWGRLYWISRQEYEYFCRRQSNSMLCNILYITHK